MLSQTAVWFGEDISVKNLIDHIFSLGQPVAVTRETIPF